ncbi:MAG: methionyl-tRNA formyltransferase [Ruminococcus callidus]
MTFRYTSPCPCEREDAAAALETLRQLAPDLIVVLAYGQLLPKEVLELPKYRCINLHASLLPAYRGAAPIQWVILNGETKTGVTAQQMAGDWTPAICW